MISFLLFVYFFIFLSLIINKLYIYALLSLLLIPIAIYIKKYLENLKTDEYKNKIEYAKKRFEKNKAIEPFLEVNKEPWYIIELIPGVSRVRAKILANTVKKTKLKSFEEFANLTGLEPALYNLVKTIVKF